MVERPPPRHRNRSDSLAHSEQVDATAVDESPTPGDTCEKDYSVGYKKPPKDHQFRPGRSGNPKGRPKGSRNLRTELEEELQELIGVTESGTRRTVSKQRAMLKSMTARAVQGDTKAANLVLNLVLRLLTQGDGEEEVDDITEEDLAILESFKNKSRGPRKQSKNTT